MGNRDTDAAWEYHNATKHSLESIRSNLHYLDWSNHPRLYKLYNADLPTISMPHELTSSGVPALEAIGSVGPSRDGERVPDLTALTTVLHFSAGITKRRQVPGGHMAFRAAACTGALYHIELYVVCGELPGLPAGVYHFGVHDMALRQLRAGDYRDLLVEATGGDRSVAEAPAILVYTSTYWRNSWKYQARTYRHCFWDSGTILANTLAMARALDLPARVVMGFLDDEVNRLLDLDEEREVALSLVPLGSDPSQRPGPSPTPERLDLETPPLSRTEVDYPIIRETHAASSLTTPEELTAWREGQATATQSPPSEEVAPLRPLDPEVMPRDSVEAVILRRGSSRRFAVAPITFHTLSTILSSATQGVPTDFLDGPEGALNDLYLIVNAVEGLASGTYVYHRERRALELLHAGEFRAQAGYLDLGQELGAEAAVNVYFLAELGPILARLGNRGYRAAHLDASITAGKLYLAAYALGLGATGLTFFDDDVTDFFSPHAGGKSVMFLTALGVPAPRRSG